MSKTIYGDINNIDVFNQEYSNDVDRIKSGKHSMIDDDLYKELIDSINVIDVNNVYEATLVGETNDEILFDVGTKDYIRVNKNNKEIVFLTGKRIGDVMDVLITKMDEYPYYIGGSVASLQEAKVHDELKSLDGDGYVEVRVNELSPAGYNLSLLHNDVSLDAFMPNTLSGVNKLHNPEEIVGKIIRVSIESYSREKGTYIVSRRKYLRTLIPIEIEKLETNTVYSGHVTGTTPFGVFVEFNECLTGMIHKSNLHPDWQNRIKEIKPGFEIDFYVKEIIKNKIILTQIQRETLWDTIKISQKIKGIVKDSKSFGLLIFLDDETVGLIHISEVEKMSTIPENGTSIDTKVLSVDRENRKIFLTKL